MNIYIPVFCFNYLIDEKGKFKGRGVRVEKAWLFWFIKLYYEKSS